METYDADPCAKFRPKTLPSDGLEERAMWEKKFGVFYFFNAVVFAASPFLPHTSIGGSRLLSIGIAADTVFLLMYHAWKKGREDD